MKNIFILLNLAVFSLLVLSCKDSLEDSIYKAYEEEPTAIWLESQPEFSEYAALLRKTNYYNALNVKMDITCFVADNDAVKEYLTSQGVNSVDELDMATANYLVRYHTIPGVKYYHESFTGKLSDSTATGDYLTIKPGEEGGLTNILVNDYARIVTRDIETVNGVVHIIDKLLNPIVETVNDIIRSNERYSIFSEAIEYCGLDELLSQKIDLLVLPI
ncbi:MAG: fasciclin domain-containing protein [Odoribacter sp.]|nr:fasciclin domain-containing protein [Odoribacter sp.]